MSFLLMVIVFMLVVAVIISAVKMDSRPTGAGEYAFDRRVALFTPAERSFLGVLDQALDGRYRVFGKVRLGDIINPAKGQSQSRQTSARNRVNQKHVDFVVCAASDLAPVGVIELDDQSHDRKERVVRDQFIDAALSAAGIPILRFSVQKGYALADVRSKLAESFAIRGAAPAPAAVPSAPVVEKAVPAGDTAAEAAAAAAAEPAETPVQEILEELAPVCPKCASVMIKRQAAKGPHAGKFFWACSAFPGCRQVVAAGEG